MQRRRTTSFFLLFSTAISLVVAARAEQPDTANKLPDPTTMKEIKAYCLDFNWAPTNRRGRPFATPGQWAAADPAAHVEWYKAIGANVIQTFCVSTNGYAWYKDGFVPEQPGLKYDFLPEVVELGHREGMLVMGYFCIASNPKWGADHPDLSYGTPTTYHIPYTDEYLDYLSKSIQDAVRKTGIDGFMIDWLWMPRRDSTEGKWLACEKRLYEQLMGQPFPGEDKLTAAQDTEYSRKSIDRCWKTIHKAAKQANPKCVVWLTVNKINHPHVINSDMYKQADWLMNEAGSMAGIHQIKDMVGEHTRLITCMARWNGADATQAVPEALAAGVGLYGFTTPRGGDGRVPLDSIFSRQVCELSGDSRSIAVLARAYCGKSIHAVWAENRFVEPDGPPPIWIRLKGRGRGFQDTALIAHNEKSAGVTITTPYARGRALLVRTSDTWPPSVAVRLQRRVGEASTATTFRMANGNVGFQASLDRATKATLVEWEGGLDLGREWKDAFPTGETPLKIRVTRTAEVVEIVIPAELTTGDPEVLAFEWE
jgi:hypothetical protein